jgi:hypothetical protein
MRVAIVHIGYGPDERDPFAQPPPYGSLLLRRSRQPVLVQLGDGMPTCRTAKSKGCPIVAVRGGCVMPSLGRALRKP